MKFRYNPSYKYSKYSINVQMIATQQSKYSKQINNKDIQSDLIEKAAKLNISKLGFETAKDVHPALDNTFILVDVNSHTNTKKVVHVTADGILLGELLIKEAQYQLFMLSPMYANILQYTDKKPQASNVQWNLLTHETISVNLNRQILPMLKVFAFSESSTFCVCQYDQHTESSANLHKQEEPGTYHTKFKLSYYKHPLRKSHQKPYVVFKTHTNPKQYGYHQEIIKLNNHSMVGSISNKMDDNDQTCLKTFDFRNVPMGIQINYKFHVQINYRKQLLGLWVTDMWELRPEHFYLKCELRVDRNKEQKFWKTTGKVNLEENLEQCLHLTWAYKNQNTIKFAKFKTPLLNSIQFLDGFKQKQRSRTIVQRSLNKQKVIYPTSVSSHIIVPAQNNQMLTIISSQQNQIVPQPNPLLQSSSSSTSTNLSVSQSFNNGQLNTQPFMQAGQLASQSTIVLQPKLQLLYTPTIYVKSLQTLPVYYVNNTTQEIVVIDREFGDWMVSYPAYYPTMAVYFRQAYNIRDNEKILDITFQKKAESFTLKQLQMFLVEELIDDAESDLGLTVGALLEAGGQKMKDFNQGWYNVDSSKFHRETKSRSNYQSRQYKS